MLLTDFFPAVINSLSSLSSLAQSKVRNLGVTFEEALSFNNHLQNIAHLSGMVSRLESEMIFHALFL